MDQNNNDSGGLVFLGGAIGVAAIGAMALKALEQVFHQLSRTFDAFGHTVGSFFPMLFNILAVTGLVAGGILIVVAAFYFATRYIKLVRRATDIVARADLQTTETLARFTEDVEQRFIQKVEYIDFRVGRVEEKLNELLTPATPAPIAEPVALLVNESSPEVTQPQEAPQVSVSQPY